MKIMTVVGARPNFMKAAPIIAAIEKFNEAERKRGSRGNGKPPKNNLPHAGPYRTALRRCDV